MSLHAGASATPGTGGVGNVVGPAASTANAIVRWDGTTGRLVKDTAGVSISDAFGITQSLSANTTGLTVTGYSLTGANAQSLVDLAGTWNTTGTPIGFKLNIVNTASNAASLLQDWQVGGSSRASIRVDGRITTVADVVAGQVYATTLLQVNTAAGTITINGDAVQARDAANAFGYRNGTSSQTGNWYDTYGGTTDYHRVAIKTARATLSGVTGASVTATGLIPDGAVLVGLTSKVTTGLGTGGGTTGYTLGDGSDADRWGSIVGTVAGTSSDNRDWTATTVQAFTSAQDVVVTAVGGNFDGTGVIYLSAQYLIGQCD